MLVLHADTYTHPRLPFRHCIWVRYWQPPSRIDPKAAASYLYMRALCADSSSDLRFLFRSDKREREEEEKKPISRKRAGGSLSNRVLLGRRIKRWLALVFFLTCSSSFFLFVFYDSLAGIGTIDALEVYLTKSSLWGAGDYLMALLGTVIISFAFHLFDRRELIRRHWVEIMSTAVISALFSMYSTAFAGRTLGIWEARVAYIHTCMHS